MEFRMTMSKTWDIPNEQKLQYEKLGFRFAPSSGMDTSEEELWTCREDYSPIALEINTLEELMDFVKVFGEIILNPEESDGNTIEIYNYYRE